MAAKLIFYGGVGSVTGANFFLEANGTKILVDCGLLQGIADATEENAKPFPYDVSQIDFLFVTHAHMDHIGRIPQLVRAGFKGVIYSTEQTRELADIMFADAVKIMLEDMKNGTITQTPYEQADVRKALLLWKALPYDTDRDLKDGLSVRLLDAGHILGSAMYRFSISMEDGSVRRIVFTGDSGNSPSPLLRDTKQITDADYLILDSVYGDRVHEPKEERDAKFEEVVRDTITAGGALIIPAFSIDRTQELLYELNNLVEEKHLPKVPVYLDSPLGLKVTDIYRRSIALFNDHVQEEIRNGDNVFDFPNLHIIHSGFESRRIEDVPNPKIILAGSGMSEGGRVVAHEMAYISDPKSTVLLVGYQALGTLGRRIQDKPSEIEIEGEKFPLRARIEMIEGFSGHRDLNGLLDLAEGTAETLKKVFVVMGEPKSSLFLVQRLRDYLDLDAVYPERGKTYDLK